MMSDDCGLLTYKMQPLQNTGINIQSDNTTHHFIVQQNDE